MKKILLMLFVVCLTRVGDAQVSGYFGGIFDNIVYFNWEVPSLHDSVHFVVEASCDGDTFENIDSLVAYSAPIELTYGVKFTSCQDVKLRLRTTLAGKTVVFDAGLFKGNTYVHNKNWTN